MAAEAVFIPTLYTSISHSAAFHCRSGGQLIRPIPVECCMDGEGWTVSWCRLGNVLEQEGCLAASGTLHEEPPPANTHVHIKTSGDLAMKLSVLSYSLVCQGFSILFSMFSGWVWVSFPCTWVLFCFTHSFALFSDFCPSLIQVVCREWDHN